MLCKFLLSKECIFDILEEILEFCVFLRLIRWWISFVWRVLFLMKVVWCVLISFFRVMSNDDVWVWFLLSSVMSFSVILWMVDEDIVLYWIVVFIKF